ncbi:glycosyltransferase [Bacillus spongiae]|uniref:Glycosyltransferase n=1 Tax=Bacillus spongiae TaxID=2683610 RepID=A0ABU8HEE7_9BACI
MMKKNLLFVIDSLDVAGAEKSLVTLLSLLDYKKYNVDLLLFSHGSLLEKLVPKEVTILPPLKYTKFSNLSVKKSLQTAVKKSEYKMLYARFRYSVMLRSNKHSNIVKARLFWESVGNVIEELPKKYDIAISYAQGIPTYFVAEKVKATKKFAWVNASYHLNKKERQFQLPYYEKYEKIVAVSDTAKNILLEVFPEYAERIKVIYDINNPIFINDMAKIGKGYSDDFSGIKILTIGRLSQSKGYDIALEACKQLKESGVNFRWYVLGKGPLKHEIEEFITEHELTDHFVLLGVKANPYPYLLNADFYVQTSRFEGFGLAIAEARMLNIPVVTTKFDSVFNQMKDGKNGLVVEMNANGVASAIVKLVENPELKENIKQYLRLEKKGNIEEIQKFYQLIS